MPKPKKLAKTLNEITSANGTVYHLGQIFIEKDGGYIRIDRIDEKEIHFQHIYNGEWHSSGSRTPDDMDGKDLIEVEGSIEDDRAKALEIFLNLDKYIEQEEEDSTPSDSTQIILSSGKSAVEAALQAIDHRRKIVEHARRVIKRKVEHMYSLVSAMEDKIKRLRRIIGVFELYLGVYEQIVQIQEGPSAPPTTPIAIRQLVLFMDEEVGDPRQKKNGQRGIDWASIDDFDTWLLNENWKTITPEERCIVVLKPSRQRRWYSSDPWFNSEMEVKNQKSYILIRNGANFYRVWASINMGDRLYPTTDETDALFKILSSDEGSKFFEQRDAKETKFHYARNAMILQGLLDRTEIFQPLPGRINLFDPDTYNGLVNFIRDDEFTLPDGRLPFFQWLRKINKKLEAGSRVFVAVGTDDSSAYVDRRNYRKRFLLYYNEHNVPELPAWGVYQLSLTTEEVIDQDKVLAELYKNPRTGEETQTYRMVDVKRRRLRIQYNPGDEVGTSSWEWNPHTRKNRLSFLIQPDTDDWIANVDQIDLADIDFYLGSRTARKDYLRMIPLLWGIRDFIESERQKEIDFVKLVAHRMQVDEAKVWAAVKWWKFKNKWKRSIRDDDPKALRMIEQRIQK